MKAKKNCFTFLFYIRKNEVNKHGECGIMCRMTIRGEKASISTRRTIAPELWDTTSGRVIGRTAKAQEINKVINDLQLTLQRHYYDIEREKGYATCEMVMNAYMGIKAKQESLMPIYKEFLEETKALIGIQKSQKTFDKYERCFRRVQEFMKSKYNISDIALRVEKPRQFKEEPTFENLRVSRLESPALLKYLSDRGIRNDIAQRYCVQVDYQMRGKS